MFKRKIGWVAVVACVGFAAATVFAQPEQGDCCGCTDCNTNFEDDACDISCSNVGIFCASGAPLILDCQWAPSCGTSLDCNSNGVPDECEPSDICNQFWSWITPCVGGLECFFPPSPSQAPGGLDPTCWCEGEWSAAPDWEYLGDDCGDICLPNPNWPSGIADHPLIEESNAIKLCVGGTTPGEQCNQHTDCLPLFVGMCWPQTELRINIVTETVGDVTIKTGLETPGEDKLTITLRPLDGGTKTLTVRTLTLDATNGQISIGANTGAVLQTDTTD